MITYQYRVNMTPGGIAPRCKLNQYDDDWTIVFSLYSGAGEFTIQSGTTAKIRGTKKDGLGYSANATIDISNQKVTVTGDKQITAVAGENTFELVLYKGEKELSTANIIFYVEPAAMDSETLVSDSQVQEILDMSANVIAASNNVSTLRGNFAPTYSSSATYAVGDYAMYNNQLYRCIIAITTAEAWTAGHWMAVSLGGDVSNLKSDVDTLNEGGLVLKDDVIAEGVSEWLDDHPEATTTVQDNSITTSKVQDGSITNDKLSADLKKPWYRIRDLTKFGLIIESKTETPNLYAENGSTAQGVCVDTARNIIYVCISVNGGLQNTEIRRYSALTYDYIDTHYYNFIDTLPGMITYLVDVDKVCIGLKSGSAAQPRNQIIDPQTMELENPITSIQANIAYDDVYGEYVAMWYNASSSKYMLTIYDKDTLSEIEQIDISTYYNNEDTMQAFSVHNGVLFATSFNYIYEIDYKNDRCNLSKMPSFTVGNGDVENEGIYATESDILMLYGGGNDFHLFSCNQQSIINPTTLRSVYSNTIQRISSAILDNYSTLFDFVVDMPVLSEKTLYSYGADDLFSGMPSLYGETSIINKIFISKPSRDLSYCKVEYDVFKLSGDVTAKYIGYFAKNTGVISWYELTKYDVISSPTFDTSYGTFSNIKYRKVGNLVYYSFVFASSSTQANATIASGLEPPCASNVAFVVNNNNASSDKFSYAWVGYDGSLKFTFNSGGSFRFNIVYVTND